MPDQELISTLAAEGYPVATTCRILQIPRSVYYRKRKQPKRASPAARESDRELVELIKAIKLEHPFWGYRRVRAWVSKRLGKPVNHKRVYRLMKQHGLLVQIKYYKAKRTPQGTKPKATHKNHWWGSDMTKFYVHTVGWVYLVIVLDWFTRKIVGHSFGLQPKTGLWIDALQMAVQHQCPAGSRSYGLHLMTDNGSQPTSQKYETVVQTLGIEHVTTSYANPRGNAETERVIRTLKEEAVWPNEFYSYADAVATTERAIRFYNTEYPHSMLADQSPIEYEQMISHRAA
jgi:transposase InsO family protein